MLKPLRIFDNHPKDLLLNWQSISLAFFKPGVLLDDRIIRVPDP